MCAKTVAFILMDVYDFHRLRALSPDCIRFMCQLNLVTVLGNQDNVDELLELVLLIESTDFVRYLESQTNRGDSAKYRKGRTHRRGCGIRPLLPRLALDHLPE